MAATACGLSPVPLVGATTKSARASRRTAALWLAFATASRVSIVPASPSASTIGATEAAVRRPPVSMFCRTTSEPAPRWPSGQVATRVTGLRMTGASSANPAMIGTNAARSFFTVSPSLGYLLTVLAIRHVPFEFGGKAEPDLTWNPGTGAQGSVEIHRGAFSVFDDFQPALDRELEAKGSILTMRLGGCPLDVRDRNLLHIRISNAVDAAVAVSSNQVVGMPELGDGATGVIEPRQDIPGIGRIFVQHAGLTPSEGYLASLAARLARKVNVDKAVQGRKGKWDADRTALLVDISTAHLAMLLGQDGLADWLDSVPVDWEDLPFAAVAVCFSNLQRPFFWGNCRYRPDLGAAERARLEPVLSALGLLAMPSPLPYCSVFEVSSWRAGVRCTERTNWKIHPTRPIQAP